MAWYHHADNWSAMRFLRLFLLFVVTGTLGVTFSIGVALLVGIWLPILKIPVFLVLSLWWLWTGWKYAKSLDR